MYAPGPYGPHLNHHLHTHSNAAYPKTCTIPISMRFQYAVEGPEDAGRLGREMRDGQRNKLVDSWWRASVARCIPDQYYFSLVTAVRLIPYLSLTAGNENKKAAHQSPLIPVLIPTYTIPTLESLHSTG